MAEQKRSNPDTDRRRYNRARMSLLVLYGTGAAAETVACVANIAQRKYPEAAANGLIAATMTGFAVRSICRYRPL